MVLVTSVPDAAYVVALAGLPDLAAGRLRDLLQRHGPASAWHRIRDGRLGADEVRHPGKVDPAAIAARWQRTAVATDPVERWRAHRRAGIGVTIAGSPAFPAVLADDDEPPSVLFWVGDLDHLAGVRAGVVGTRDATRYGIDVAHGLGRDLALAGVAVVSGLALGIDGAAHAGVLAVDGAPPLAVVGSGLDCVYPRDHRALWKAVGERGLVLTEYPLGTRPAPWRFPARNRLLAALSDVVVVVESHATGGAMGTAEAADRRGRTVLAVPGPVTAPSSDGTNQLLFEGRGPARDAADVMLALGLAGATSRPSREDRPVPVGDAAQVLEALPWQPVGLERLVLATGLDLGVVALAVDELEALGWVARRAGWVERVGRRSGR